MRNSKLKLLLADVRRDHCHGVALHEPHQLPQANAATAHVQLTDSDVVILIEPKIRSYAKQPPRGFFEMATHENNGPHYDQATVATIVPVRNVIAPEIASSS
jgi:hypothetical protein